MSAMKAALYGVRRYIPRPVRFGLHRWGKIFGDEFALYSPLFGGTVFPPVHATLEGHLPAAEERAAQVEFVQSPHQAQVLGALRLRPVIVGRAWQTKQFALLLNGQARMVRLDP